PFLILDLLNTISDNPIIILLIINIILLIIGTFMDMTPAVLIFTPIFLPVVTELGMDPIHFGIVMVLNMCIGICTPPVGSVLFVGCSV
ncbi:TRAP transporter large permease subunit, partial [Escherichia coli]|nr:TRAP transporter large permease subunit [Escherichia coli]